MNFPNILTVLRIVMTVFFAFLLQARDAGGAVAAIVLFVLASLTDFLDGYWARKYGLITTFGKIMDPIADKCLVLTAFFIFALQGIVAWWMVVIIALREVLVTAFRVYAIMGGRVLPAESAGKIKTAFQMGTISAILLYRFLGVWPVTQGLLRNLDFVLVFMIQAFMIGAMVLTVWSGLSLMSVNKGEKVS